MKNIVNLLNRFRMIVLITLICGLAAGLYPFLSFHVGTIPSPAAACTLYASASGNDGNSGTSPTSPKSFTGAASVAQPGYVVCVLAGTYSMSSTFYPPRSGKPSAWIVYRSYGDGDANFVWTGGPNASDLNMFHFHGATFPSGPAYLEFRGFKLDGQNYASNGFFCAGSHHLRFIGNTISNTGGAGIGSVLCDYLTSDHNIINHNGYRYGWTSGISYNSNQWFDFYRGFHNVISNNVIAGEYDSTSDHTDGNGIILDLSNRTYDYRSANTPPALVINNVIYGNGGRCIEAYVVTNFWIVNNTCYKNGLDPSSAFGSLVTSNSRDGYFVNNIAVAWHGDNSSYGQENTNENIHYYADLYFGSSNNFTYSDPAQFIHADPLFFNPPFFDPAARDQYATALPPSQLGNGLMLQPDSPALQKGIDPSTLPKLPVAIAKDLKNYIYADINGNPRPQGGHFDLGAYQHSLLRPRISLETISKPRIRPANLLISHSLQKSFQTASRHSLMATMDEKSHGVIVSEARDYVCGSSRRGQIVPIFVR
jgi:hypothetical protein